MKKDWRDVLESLSPGDPIDAHTHTYYSDGTSSPKELVDLAVESGLSGISITDHDTLEGYLSCSSIDMPENFLLIPGIEFTAYWGEHEVHILAYGVDPDNLELRNFNDAFKEARLQRAKKIISNLSVDGIHIDWDKFLQKHPAIPLGRPHIAQELVDAGYCRHIYEAFDKYLGNHSKYVVTKFDLKVSDVGRIAHNAGGKAVLAHPGQLPKQVQVTPILIAGVDGLEALYPQHHVMQERAYERYAKKRKIPITGGSDFHGAFKPRIKLGMRTTSVAQMRELLGIK